MLCNHIDQECYSDHCAVLKHCKTLKFRARLLLMRRQMRTIVFGDFLYNPISCGVVAVILVQQLLICAFSTQCFSALRLIVPCT